MKSPLVAGALARGCQSVDMSKIVVNTGSLLSRPDRVQICTTPHLKEKGRAGAMTWEFAGFGSIARHYSALISQSCHWQLQWWS